MPKCGKRPLPSAQTISSSHQYAPLALRTTTNQRNGRARVCWPLRVPCTQPCRKTSRLSPSRRQTPCWGQNRWVQCGRRHPAVCCQATARVRFFKGKIIRHGVLNLNQKHSLYFHNKLALNGRLVSYFRILCKSGNGYDYVELESTRIVISCLSTSTIPLLLSIALNTHTRMHVHGRTHTYQQFFPQTASLQCWRVVHQLL